MLETIFNQSFKKRHAKIILLIKFINSSIRLQLLMISDQYNMFRILCQRCKNVCFEYFCSFFNNNNREVYSAKELTVLCSPCCRHSNNILGIQKLFSFHRFNILFKFVALLIFIYSLIEL
jgi:hypothetical protein